MTKLCLLVMAAAIAVGVTSCNSGTQKQSSTDSTKVTDSVKLQLVTGDVKFPVQVTLPPDGSKRQFVTDLSGRIYILKDGHILPVPFLDISSRLEKKDANLEIKGMYSMAFSPQYAKDGKFYVIYNAPTKIDSNKTKLVVSQFTVSASNPDMADSTSEKRVFELEGHSVYADPCEIKFGPDGYLYISLGDNGTPMALRKAQNLSSYLGKLLRINVSTLPYTVPADNPFVNTKDAKPEIWAYGFRRLWRFDFDSKTHNLIGADVGDKINEEIDIVTKGGNYGWPLMEGDSARVGKDSLPKSNYVAPLLTYTHKDGICAIGGSDYYGSNIPSLDSKYVFADYNGTLYYLTDSSNVTVKEKLDEVTKPDAPFIVTGSDVGPGNEIYFMGVLNAKDGFKGVIYQLVNAGK